MNKFKTYKLDEVLTFRYGKDQKKVVDKEGKYPILGTGGQMGWTNSFLYDKPSVLIGRKGTINNPFYMDTPFWTIDTLFYTEINEEKIFPKYLFYKFRLINFLRYNEATGVPSLKTDTLNRIPITIHEDIPTQQKIANVLSDLDAKIELNNRINVELEAMAKTLYDYWFVQFDFPDAEGKPYKTSGGVMVWNEDLKREIPEGWEVKRLIEIEDNIVTGKTPPTTNREFFGGDIPFITIGDIRGNMHIFDTQIKLSSKGGEYQKGKFLPEGAICVSCIASPGLIGFTTQDSQTNQQINSIICKNYENRFYLYFALNDFFKYSSGAAKTGNTFANMNKEDFSSINLIYPNKASLLKFKDIVESTIKKISNNSKENQQLSSLRDWLLPMLMNGQVVVE